MAARPAGNVLPADQHVEVLACGGHVTTYGRGHLRGVQLLTGAAQEVEHGAPALGGEEAVAVGRVATPGL